MKIEAGKYYKTRDGKKAFVEHVFQKSPFSGSSPSGYTSFGFIEGNGQVDWWTADGFYVTCGQGCNDLVAEWREPRVVVREVLLVETRSGDFGCVFDQWQSLGDRVLARKKVTITEGEGV
jgi:hypothetical protein